MGTRAALVEDINRAIRDLDRAMRVIVCASRDIADAGDEAGREWRTRREEARVAAMSHTGLIAELNRMLVKDAAGRCLATLRRRQGQRVLPATWALLLLLARASLSGTFPRPQQAADGRPVDDLSPPWTALRARTVLTAAPPLPRAPAPCGSSHHLT